MFQQIIYVIEKDYLPRFNPVATNRSTLLNEFINSELYINKVLPLIEVLKTEGTFNYQTLGDKTTLLFCP